VPVVRLLGILALLIAGGVGLPIPEDMTLIGAGMLAQQRLLPVAGVLAVGLLGVAAADWVLYLTGRRWGSHIVDHPRLGHFVGAERLARARATLGRNGVTAVFLARFVFGTRLVTFLSAGAVGVPPLQFAVGEGAGTAVFVPATITLGWVFSHHADRLLADIERFEHRVLLGGLSMLALYLVLRATAWRRLNRVAPPPGAAGSPPSPPADRDRPS
jgi:membrane protein DedA with SNARE-associated domain